jgi:helix-turn-helix protein
MREPYPLALVPLLPQFLQRRRAKSDFPLRAMERLGLDRPAYFSTIDLGTQDPRGARPQDVQNSAYRTSDEPLRAPFAAAESVGLVTWGEGRWSLTDKGRRMVDEFRRAIDGYFAGLSPIPTEDLEQLGRLLDDALSACVAAPEPKTREHTPRAARYRWQKPSSAFARLDAAVYGLWQVRDDCHVQAWRDAGLTGPALDALTRLWRKEAATEDELASKISTQSAADVRASVQQLRSDGLLRPEPDLALTGKGIALRERIEAETDRYFFSPWADAVAAKADWVTERLAAVNAALA